MTDLAIYPRAASAGVLRVWLGVFDADALPNKIDWKLDGTTVLANVIKPMGPAHSHNARTFTGVFEFINEAAIAEEKRVGVTVSGGVKLERQVRAVPARITSDDWMRILLSSCYHQYEDRSGLTSLTYDNIPAAERPDLTLLMGDQVYLDLPTLKNFPDNEAKLARKFEAAYGTNWTASNGLTKILASAPSISCPDDHEYWNNFPHISPIIQNSWKEASRKRWRAAADQLFDAFQVPTPLSRGENLEIDIDPFSIIILDQRTQRQTDRTTTLGSNGLKQLEAWVDRLIREQKFGAVVTGQSLLDKPVGEFAGKVADWMLPNYEDYEAVVRALSKLADAGRTVLLLTGDVHWGRITKIRQAGRTRFIEIICSPTSLVTTIGADQKKQLGAGFRKFFLGEETRWPRHSKAPDAEAYFAPQVFGKIYKTETIYKHQGDQLATLALRKAANTMEAKVTYREIHETPQPAREIHLGLLRSGI